MAKKNRKSWFSSTKKLTRTEKKERSHALRNTIIIFAFIVVLVAAGVGFMFLERFVKTNLALDANSVPLQLVDFPVWAGDELKTKILSTAGQSEEDFRITDAAAMRIGENLDALAWLYDVKVQVSKQVISVSARYRKPIGLIMSPRQRFYIDSEFVILDYIPLDRLPVLQIIGVPSYELNVRSVGSKWQKDEVAAAVELIELLTKMDNQVTPDKPLLTELKSIDMSNFNGRRSSTQPHIVFYAKDGTEIRWGAQKGHSQRYLEAKDEEKLTLLYNTFEQFGTVQLKAAHKGSFIDLTQPQSLP
ncbi:MAG: hypothetical protein JW806_05690 [Sedimentisphaerales bacterium]|nr:hypothetical protein [Sedimentisphaerales bacterium]